jgi:hypothetical protein
MHVIKGARMDLETIYYIGQTVAVLVIIATLAAVLYQSRQANKIARADLTRAQLTDAATIVESIYSSPALLDLLLKVDGRKPLSDRELLQFQYYMYSWWNNLEGAFQLSKEKLIDPLSYTQLLRTGSYLYRANLTQSMWRDLRGGYPPDFAAELDAIIEAEKDQPPMMNKAKKPKGA